MCICAHPLHFSPPSAQEITGDILLELTIDSLKELDVNTFGKRFKIHSAINALRDGVARQHTSKQSVAESEASFLHKAAASNELFANPTSRT